MRLILAAPTLMLALLFALPAAAETRQHGNVIFDLPEGWRIGKVRQDGTQVIWSDLPDDACRNLRHLYRNRRCRDRGAGRLSDGADPALRRTRRDRAAGGTDGLGDGQIHGRPGGMQGRRWMASCRS